MPSFTQWLSWDNKDEIFFVRRSFKDPVFSESPKNWAFFLAESAVVMADSPLPPLQSLPRPPAQRPGQIFKADAQNFPDPPSFLPNLLLSPDQLSYAGEFQTFEYIPSSSSFPPSLANKTQGGASSCLRLPSSSASFACQRWMDWSSWAWCELTQKLLLLLHSALLPAFSFRGRIGRGGLASGSWFETGFRG